MHVMRLGPRKVSVMEIMPINSYIIPIYSSRLKRRRGSKGYNIFRISTWKGSKMGDSRTAKGTGEIAFIIMAINLSVSRARNTEAVAARVTADRFFCGIADDTGVSEHKINHREILRWGGRMCRGKAHGRRSRFVSCFLRGGRWRVNRFQLWHRVWIGMLRWSWERRWGEA